LGLGTVACAHMMDLKVSAVSDRATSCELAQKWGTRVVCRNDAPSLADVDCVVLTSALWKDWLLSLKTVRVGGVIAVLGFPGRGQGLPDFNPLDSQWLYDKRLTIKATGPPESAEDLRRNLGHLLHCMAVGQLDGSELISKIVDWRELPDLYATMASNRGGMLSAVLKW
jgi:threonine dehydrogenase-like Zn-dependent dehydrogenase